MLDHDDAAEALLLFGFHPFALAATEQTAFLFNLLLLLLGADRERNLADERHRELLEILAATHCGVEIFLEDYNGNGDSNTNDESGQQNHRLARFGGGATAVGMLDDAGVVGRECLRELVLLAFLQKIDVQCFFHFLLAFYGQQLFRFCRA